MLRVPSLTNNRMFLSRLLLMGLCIYVILSRPPVFISPWISDVLNLLGMVLVAIAAFGRIWCLSFVAGRKNDVLISEGPYSVTRNPLYVFSFLGIVGFGLVVENPALALGLGILFFAYYPFVVRREERYLESRFGMGYSAYCLRTPRWIPDFSLYREPQTITISPARFRAGLLDSLWFVSAFVLWELLEVLRRSGLSFYIF